jgi:hypothetical protein
MDGLRRTEYESFASIGMERAKTANVDAYSRINKEKELIKERMRLAGGTNKALFNDLFASGSEEGSEDLDDEDFYNNDGSDVETSE